MDNYPLPLVYQFPAEFKPGNLDHFVRLIPAQFYQTTESYADYPNKSISKIVYDED